MQSKLGIWTAGCLMLCGWSHARAEVFELANGGQIVGQLLNAEEPLRTHYEIKTPLGIRLKLERTQVRRVVHQRPVEEELAELRSKSPDTAEAQWALAEWCREQNLNKDRQTHLQRILELDPEHLDARRVLGYSKINGTWMTQADRMTDNGYVFYRGQWRLPQQVELLEQKDKQERAEKEWYRKLKMYRSWLEDKRQMQAVQKIKDIDDPYAVRGLSEYMKEEPNWQVRKLYAEALGNIHTNSALEAMVIRTLVDVNDEVRYTCMDYFDEKNPELVAMYIRALRSKDNVIINRAAEGLKKLNHPAAVGALIDALVTEHKFKVTTGTPGGGMSMSFANPSAGAGASAIGPNPGGLPSMGGSAGGLNGFSAGSSTKIYTQQAQNMRVLEALVALTNQNFQFNVDHWKLWLQQQKSPTSLGSRRD